MALDTLNRQIEALRQQATDQARSYRNERAAIENDRRLTLEGKEELLTPLSARTKATLESLGKQEDKLLKDRMESLQSSLVTKLGSTSTDIIAMRDAEDRADRLENGEEAARVLERAIRSGDRSLAHAILRRGLEAGWRDVVNQATTAFPEAADTLRDLTEVEQALNGMGAILGRAMHYNIGL